MTTRIIGCSLLCNVKRRWGGRRPSPPTPRSTRVSCSSGSLCCAWLGGRVVAGDDLPEVDVLDGLGDDLGRVFAAGGGAVEVMPGESDARGVEVFVDGVPVVGGDRVDVVVVGVVAEGAGDVVGEAGRGAGVGDVAAEAAVAGGGRGPLLSVLAVVLSDSAFGEAEFCSSTGLGAPLPLGGVPLDGFADDAAASGRQLAVDVRLDAF